MRGLSPRKYLDASRSTSNPMLIKPLSALCMGSNASFSTPLAAAAAVRDPSDSRSGSLGQNEVQIFRPSPVQFVFEKLIEALLSVIFVTL